jgi:hypothetical protein
MGKRPSQRIRKALADLTKALQQIEAPSMVIGGIAVIAHGVARQTVDIDATILATRLDPTQILAILAGNAIQPRIADVWAARRRHFPAARVFRLFPVRCRGWLREEDREDAAAGDRHRVGAPPGLSEQETTR